MTPLFAETPLATARQSAVPSTLPDAGHHFTLTATDQTNRAFVTQFPTVNYQMTVTYNATDIPSTGVRRQ